MQFEGREYLIKRVQKLLNIVDDGKDGSATWNAILNKLAPPSINTESKPLGDSILSEKAFKLIIKHEVGGGETYYNRSLKNPCYPGGESGVTIGIGYDIGYATLEQFQSDWSSLLPTDSFNRLSKHIGKKSSSAKFSIAGIKDIEIGWDTALKVFNKRTLPKYIKETLKAFPGSDNLHPDAFGALVSIVFNRGGSTTGPSRLEMANIKKLIDSKNYIAIAQEITNMKRLWVGKGLDGLLRRRDEEAALVKACA